MKELVAHIQEKTVVEVMVTVQLCSGMKCNVLLSALLLFFCDKYVCSSLYY